MLKKIIIGIFKPKFLFRWIVKSKAKSCKGKLSVNGFSTVNQNTHLGYNVNFNGKASERTIVKELGKMTP